MQDRYANSFDLDYQPLPATGAANFAVGLIGRYWFSSTSEKTDELMFANIDAQANLSKGTFVATFRNFHLADTNHTPTERLTGAMTVTRGSNGI